MATTAPSRLLPVAAAALLGGVLALHTLDDRAAQAPVALLCWGLAALGYLGCCQALWRGAEVSFGKAFGLVLLLRAIALCLPPAFSDDLPRYLWEGLIQHHGWNPYLHGPLDPRLQDLATAHAEIWQGINHKEVPAAYPPAMQLVQWAVTALAATPLAMKLLFGTLDVLVFVVLWQALPAFGRPATLALVWGLSPLCALEFAAEGHNDSLGLLALVLALWCGALGRPWLAGAALGLGIAAKLLPVVALPFLCRKDWRVLPACGLVVLLCCLPYLPFAEPTWAVLEGLREYGTRWRANDSAYALLDQGTARLQAWAKAAGVPHAPGAWWSFLVHGPTHSVAKLPLLALLLAVAAWCWRRRLSPAAASAVLITAVLLCSPTVHPWYVAWLLPLACIFRLPFALAWSLLVVLAYAAVPQWRLVGSWQEPWWAKGLQYGVVYGLLLWAWSRSRQDR